MKPFARPFISMLPVVAAIQPSLAQRDSVQRLPLVKTEAVAPGTGHWPQAARDALIDSLRAARARWAAHRPARYRIAVEKQCGFCGQAPWDPPGTRPEYVVVGDSVVGVVSVADTARHAVWLRMTVEAMFAEIETEWRDERRQIIGLAFDPYYGYPLRWQTDDARNGYGIYITDQGYWATVRAFVSDSIGPPARRAP